MPESDSFGPPFSDQSAKQWLSEQERSAFLGELQPIAMIRNKHTFSDGVNRYKREELPKMENDAKNREHHLNWFEKRLGKIKFSSIRSSDVKDAVLILENEMKPNGKPLAPATIIRYLASPSHLFSIA